MVNAGGEWSDTEVIRDGNLITSREAGRNWRRSAGEIIRALAKT